MLHNDVIVDVVCLGDTILNKVNTRCNTISLCEVVKRYETYLILYCITLYLEPNRYINTNNKGRRQRNVCIISPSSLQILGVYTKFSMYFSALEEMRYIAKHWEEWAMNSMIGLPQTFVKKRLTISHQFAQSVKRQCTFLHLAKV